MSPILPSISRSRGGRLSVNDSPRQQSSSSSSNLLDKLTIACSVFIFTDAWIWTSETTIAQSADRPYGYLLKSAAYILFVVNFVRYFRSGLGVNIISVLFILQLSLMLIFLFISASLFYSTQYLISLMGLTFGLAVIYENIGLDEVLRRCLNILIIILLSSVIISIFFPQFGVSQLGDLEGTWRGMFNHKNSLGYVSWASGLLLMSQWNRQPFFVSLFQLSVITLCLIFSKSSTSILCFVLAIFVLAVLSALRRLLSGGLFFRFLVTFFALAIAVFVAFFWADILYLLGKDDTLTGRVGIWKLMLRLWEDRPIFGHGIAYFITDIDTLAQIRAATFASFVGAHNAYLQAMVDTGLIGLFLFTTPYLLLILVWLNNPRRFREINPDLALAITLSFMLYYVTEANNSFYFGFGTMLINLLFISSFGKLSKGVRRLSFEGRTLSRDAVNLGFNRRALKRHGEKLL